MSLREQTGLLAYSPWRSAAIDRQIPERLRPEKGRLTLFSALQPLYPTPRRKKACGATCKLARTTAMDPAQMALAFVTRQPFVTSNIIAPIHMEPAPPPHRNLEQRHRAWTAAISRSYRRDSPKPSPTPRPDPPAATKYLSSFGGSFLFNPAPFAALYFQQTRHLRHT